MSCVTHKLLLTVALSVLATPVVAQTPSDPSSSAKVHIGPLALSPSISLTNLGVDNNVFNDADQESPKSDFTMTVEPRTDVWLHVGRSILIGSATEDLVYYRTYVNQRSASGNFKVGILVPLTRLTLAGNAGYLDTKDRPGFEIDARARRHELAFDGRVEIRVLSKTYVGVKATRQKTDFATDAVFLGTNLRNELNRTVTTESVTVRHQLTPLTSVNLDLGREQDRFEFSPLRDSDSTKVSLGVKFDPFALLKGGAALGYRDFTPLVAGVPSFRGLVADVDLSYVALGSTKLSVQGSRDVQYSFDVNQPYYVMTGFSASLAQQIFGPVDAVGRIGAQRLDYRNRAGALIVVANRTDYVHAYGGGLGYHLGPDIRVGFNVDHVRRTSAAINRTYSGLRYGMAVTYGF